MGEERGRRSAWPILGHRGIGWRRAMVMLVISLLLHVSLFGLAGLFRFVPVVTEEEAAASTGEVSEMDILPIEPEFAVEQPTEVEPIDEPVPPADFVDVPPEPTPKTVEMPRPIVAQRPVPLADLRWPKAEIHRADGQRRNQATRFKRGACDCKARAACA
jgi:hypothetical protein